MSLPVANRGLFRRMSLAFTGIFTFLVSVTHPPVEAQMPVGPRVTIRCRSIG
jgi:hypothetical protein